jgi:putative endonuclease
VTAPDPDRKRAHLYGLEAERVASLWLQARFYSVLERRYTIKGGEIDLVVKRGATVAFVEIKARARIEDAEISIDARKIDRIARAARHWVARNPWAIGCHLRGDAVYLAPGRLPRHVEAAFVVPVDLYERKR